MLFQELAQFLPRSASPTPLQGAADTAAEAPLPAPPEFLEALRRLHETEWPALRESLAINECREFADKLTELARSWPCPSLDLRPNAR